MILGQLLSVSLGFPICLMGLLTSKSVSMKIRDNRSPSPVPGVCTIIPDSIERSKWGLNMSERNTQRRSSSFETKTMWAQTLKMEGNHPWPVLWSNESDLTDVCWPGSPFQPGEQMPCVSELSQELRHLSCWKAGRTPASTYGVRHSLAFVRGQCWGPASLRDLPQLTSG